MLPLADVLVAVRRTRGLTLRDVEAKGGIDSGQVSKVESGKATRPTLTTVLRIFRGLGLSVEDYFGHSNLPYHPQRPAHIPEHRREDTVLNEADVDAFVKIVLRSPEKARFLLATLLNTINDMRYGAGPDGLHFDATTVDLFLDDAGVRPEGAAVYRFTLRYPEDISLATILDIDGNNGVLLPTDVAVYLRKVYLAKLPPKARQQPEQILGRMDALHPENIAFRDVMDLEQRTGYTGYILDMYQRACTFNDNLLRPDPQIRWGAPETGFAYLFILACRWLQHLSVSDRTQGGSDRSATTIWLEHVRLLVRASSG